MTRISLGALALLLLLPLLASSARAASSAPPALSYALDNRTFGGVIAVDGARWLSLEGVDPGQGWQLPSLSQPLLPRSSSANSGRDAIGAYSATVMAYASADGAHSVEVEVSWRSKTADMVDSCASGGARGTRGCCGSHWMTGGEGP